MCRSMGNFRWFNVFKCWHSSRCTDKILIAIISISMEIPFRFNFHQWISFRIISIDYLGAIFTLSLKRRQLSIGPSSIILSGNIIFFANPKIRPFTVPMLPQNCTKLSTKISIDSVQTFRHHFDIYLAK